MNKQKSTRDNYSNRDVSVDVLRIVAACMVIGTHVKLGGVIDEETDYARILISCFVGDGVAVFWMIMGFFVFAASSYQSLLKRTARRIILPMFMYSILMFYFYEYLLGKATFIDSIHRNSEEYIAALKSVLKWQPFAPATGHFWYLYVYIIIVVVFPFVKGGFSFFVGNEKKGQLTFALILFMLLVINDLTFNGFFEFSHHAFAGAIGGIIWVMLGSVFYSHKSMVEKSIRCGIGGICLFVIVNIIRAYYQQSCYRISVPTEEPLYWYTGWSVLSVLGLSLSVYGFLGRLERFAGFKRAVTHVGRLTFSVYFVHILVRDYLSKYDLSGKLIMRYGNSGIGAIKYEIVYLFTVFFISIFIGEIVLLVKNGIAELYSRR